MSGKEILFDNGATAQIDAALRSQYASDLATQVGFWINVNEVHRDFYKVAVMDQNGLTANNDNLLVNNAVADVSNGAIYDALATTTIGYLADVSGGANIETDVYSASGCADNNNPGDSGAPGTNASVGEHVIKGLINAAFTGDYSTLMVDDSNVEALMRNVAADTVETADATCIDRLIAEGLGSALSGASQDQHDDALRQLLAQLTNAQIVEDFSGNVTNDVAYEFYRSQILWMKLDLTIRFNQATSDFYDESIDSSSIFNTSYKGETDTVKSADVNATFAACDGVAQTTSGADLDALVISMLVKLNVGA